MDELCMVAHDFRMAGWHMKSRQNIIKYKYVAGNF